VSDDLETIAPAAGALTSVRKVRLLLARNASSDRDETDKLQYYINAYSTQIRLYTGRQFLPTETAATKKYRYEGSGYLSLAPYELSAAPTSVTLYTDLPETGWDVLAAQDASTESQYRLEPRAGTPQGTYTWLALPLIGMFSPLVPEPLINRRDRGHEVTIVGNWGIGYVPEDVDLACAIAVANAYRNPAAFQSMAAAGMSYIEAPEPGGMGDDSGRSLPRDSRALLAPYRQHSFA
jgi:hypothetical protein